ncbi:hypothetical protein ACW73L_19650 [Methylolobus aquaticus]
MTRNERQVMGLDDFTEIDLQAIKQAKPPREAAAFDREMNATAVIEPQRPDNTHSG